jgi:DNA-binding NtrC family response regulator
LVEKATGIAVAEWPAMPRSPRPPPRHVTIVSDNAETLDGLETYLQRAGLTTNGTRHLDKACEMTPPVSSAVLLFPDDFRSVAVVTALAKLASQRPKVLRVLVTREPKLYETLPSHKGAIAPLVVPKPIFGWTILDVIRARIGSEAVENEEVQ